MAARRRQPGAPPGRPVQGGPVADLLAAQRALRSGAAAAAEQACRRVLRRAPEHLDALNMLSVALGRQGRHAEGERISRRAVALDPNGANALANLAERVRQQGRLDDAIDGHRRALARAPDHLVALDGLARALAEADRSEEALAPARRANQQAPERGTSHALLGEILALLRRHDEAIAAIDRALALDPTRLDWWRNLGRLSLAAGDVAHLEPAARRLLAADPDDDEAKVLMANALFRQDVFGETRRLLAGVTASGTHGANAKNLLGVVLARMARLDEALAALDEARDLAPDATELLANRLLHLNYASHWSAAALKGEHVAFAARFGAPALQPATSFAHDRAPDRRLRIGYLSPDFRRHSVTYFTAPLLRERDRESVEVLGYASVGTPDEVTEALAAEADAWRDVRALDDAALAEQIRADRIDILVELAGHTRDSRLLACARRPAPIQIAYLGYPNTTGLSAIDYRITDHVADPDGFDDHYTETLIRLPRCFLAYDPPRDAPLVAPPPMLARGRVTFGSFNNLAKVDPEVVALWAAVLRAVPDARLLLKSAGTGDGATRASLEGSFAAHGIDPNRLEILPPAMTPHDHLATYGRVDIALDPFPYNGTTTTCEALWMGVPVITLAGERHASRVGASLLTAIGFPAGIAQSPDDYVLTARLLAGRADLLTATRGHLRADMQRSPLCDVASHARALEDAYRAVWQMWCTAPAAA